MRHVKHVAPQKIKQQQHSHSEFQYRCQRRQRQHCWLMSVEIQCWKSSLHQTLHAQQCCKENADNLYQVLEMQHSSSHLQWPFAMMSWLAFAKSEHRYLTVTHIQCNFWQQWQWNWISKYNAIHTVAFQHVNNRWNTFVHKKSITNATFSFRSLMSGSTSVQLLTVRQKAKVFMYWWQQHFYDCWLVIRNNFAASVKPTSEKHRSDEWRRWNKICKSTFSE